MPHTAHPDLSRTTIVDAVEYLAGKMPQFEQYGLATIKLTRMGFPEFSIRTLVYLWSGLDGDGNGLAVGLASADFFTARQAIDGERRRYPIEMLEDAKVDGFANVTCANGMHFYDVRLEAERPLRGELRQAEWRALEYCVAMHEGKTGEAEPIAFYPELVARLQGFSQGPLKAAIGYIRDNQPTGLHEPPISIETLRSALRIMGLRRPKHGAYAEFKVDQSMDAAKRTQKN